MTKSDIKDALASRLVEREVIYNVSLLMYGVSKLMWNTEFGATFDTDGENLSDLFSCPDYEEAAFQFIINVAEVAQLEEIADTHSSWDGVLASAGIPTQVDVNEWLNTYPGYGRVMRMAVFSTLTSHEAYRDICCKFDLEVTDLEVFEHWIVSNYLAAKLTEYGEVVREFAGLTIWGRTTTGQMICMDCVIRQIASEIWEDELEGDHEIHP